MGWFNNMAQTTLIIARHGNTFESHQTPTRVGGRTDLPLVASGITQAKNLGAAWLAQKIVPHVVFASGLQRTQQTANYALQQMGQSLPVQVDTMFNEIDYGPDENQPEAQVIGRLGQQALDDWDAKALVPNGWLLNPLEKIEQWQNLAHNIVS